jgi:hypothetical protein
MSAANFVSTVDGLELEITPTFIESSSLRRKLPSDAERHFLARWTNKLKEIASTSPLIKDAAAPENVDVKWCSRIHLS